MFIFTRPETWSSNHQQHGEHLAETFIVIEHEIAHIDGQIKSAVQLSKRDATSM